MRSRPATPLIATALLAMVALTGCGGGSKAAAGSAPSTGAETAASTAASAAATGAAGSTVQLKLLSFVPDTVTVKPGTTVQWTDDNPITHTITSGKYTVGNDGLRTAETPDGMFDGKVAAKGDTFSYTFPDAGTYTYFCSIHKGMNATIIVAG